MVNGFAMIVLEQNTKKQDICHHMLVKLTKAMIIIDVMISEQQANQMFLRILQGQTKPIYNIINKDA